MRWKAERLYEQTGESNGSPLNVQAANNRGPSSPRSPRALTLRLNQSGWLADEVLAAGALRQSKQRSLLALVTGVALIEVLRPRRSKSRWVRR